jgi:hypothetical protein
MKTFGAAGLTAFFQTTVYTLSIPANGIIPRLYEDTQINDCL